MNKYLVFLISLGFISTLSPLYSQCSFTLSNDIPCSLEEVTFSVDNPVAGSTYEWDMDEDGTPDLSGPSVEYSFPAVNVDSIFTIALFQDGIPCDTQAIMVLALPDAAIGVPPGIVILNGNEIKACNGSSSFELEIYNASSTISTDVSYTINWGDGSPPEEYDNTTFSNTSTISHTYTALGYYTLFITAVGQNGCVFTNNYTFYNGGNPSVGVVIPGNTVGLCAPATLDFPITNTDGNPPGTEYTIYISGTEVAYFTQDSLPDVFTYTFLESSCGETTSTGNYENAFDIKIVASNPCNSSTATIEPIEVSEPPEPFFEILPPAFSCEGAIYGFENNTTNINEVIAGNPSECIDVLNPNWTISGGMAGDDWNVVSGNLFGSNNIEIEFLTPGVYVIEMTLVSFACGPVSFSQEITIFDPPIPEIDIQVPDPGGSAEGGCAPLVVPFNNSTSGGELLYQWEIAPDEGWAFVDSTDATSVSPVVEFTEGGNYDILLTVSNPCAEVNWDTTILMPGPPGIELGPLPDFCESGTLQFDTSNLSVQLNGSAATDYQWSFPGGMPESSTDSLPSGIVYDLPGTYVVELSINNACGTSVVQDTFIVQETTVLNMPSDFEVCSSDASVQLQANPEGGTWSGSGVTANGTFDPAAAAAGDNILTYNYGTGVCSLEGTLMATVIPAAVIDAGPDEEVCSSQASVSLSGSPQNGNWSTSDNDAVLSGNTFLPPESGPGTFTLLYSFVDNNNCSSTDSLIVEVLPAPAVSVSDTAYCDTPGAVPLPTPQPGGGSWSGPGVVDASQGLFDPAVAGGAGNYQLTYSLQGTNGCNTNAPVAIGVIDPSNVDAGPPLTFCITDESVNLNAGATPSGGNWSGPGSGLNGSTFNPALAGGGSFTFTYQVGAGNCAVQDDLQVEVFDPGPVEAGPGQSLCLSDNPVALSGASPANGQWSGPGLTNGAFNPQQADVGSHLLVYTILDEASGCTKSDTLEMVVWALPEAAFQVEGITCQGSDLAIENQSDEDLSFNWQFGNGSSSQAFDPQLSYADTGLFTILLRVTNSNGCQASVSREVEVVAPPNAAFSPDMAEGCGGQEITFLNQSQGFEMQFEWNFGNGASSSDIQPANPQFYPAGLNDTTYYLSLTAENICGQTTVRDTILVKAFPVVDFGFQVDTGCAPLLVEFANISTGSPQEYYWIFGNGQTSTDSLPPPQLYEGDTTVVDYPITLIASNSCGTDTLQKVLTIEPEEVTAFINTSNTLGCTPFEVSFANYSTTGTQASWDFGDGNIVAESDPVHTFTEPGIYEVQLHAANACAEDSTTVVIEALPSPEVSFEYGPNRCVGQPIQFTNTSEGLAGSIWSFSTGDSTVLTNPSYSFPEPGTYTVTLTGISPANSCSSSLSHQIEIQEAPEAAFSPEEEQGCTPLTVGFTNQSTGGLYYEWDFGDGNSSVEANPVHTFSDTGHFEVQLTISNEVGCQSDTIFPNIFAYPVPEAAFSIDMESPCGLPALAAFNNQSTGAQGYNWNLGLSGSSNLANPVQSYSEAGLYEIELVASNTYGCLDTSWQEIPIYDSPIADFALDSTSGCQPLRVQLANYSRGNRYKWDFGDGTTSTEAQPEHVYTEPGEYDISLTVAYDSLCYDDLILPAAATVYQMPSAEFEWIEEELDGSPTGMLSFINTSSQASYFLWDFGDGSYSEEVNPVHRYDQNGAYQVLLTAGSEGGCTDDTLMIIRPELIKGLYVPNAFSPDQGTGDARWFLPKGIGLKEYQVQVFSPYGQLLWESTALRDGSPSEGWDGTLNGTELPQDVYVWKVQAIFEDETVWRGSKISSGNYEKMGSVTLIR